MNNESSVEHLDDSAALRVLSHLTEQLREGMTTEQQGAVKNVEEAQRALVSFLELQGVPLSVSEAQELGRNATGGAAARGTLELMLQDSAVRGEVEALLLNVPDDAQRSVELALSGAIILGGLLGWLQTKVEIQVSRKNRETEFHFSIKKNSSRESSLKAIAQAIRGLLVR